MYLFIYLHIHSFETFTDSFMLIYIVLALDK